MEHEKELLALLERIAVALEAKTKKKNSVKEPVQERPGIYSKLESVLLARMKYHETITPLEGDWRGLGDFNMKVGILTQMAIEDLGLKEHTLMPQRVGNVLRHSMKMKMSERKRDGFHVWWNKGELEGK